MFEIVKILYRELHYQIVKRNPLVANNERRFKKQLKTSLNMKRRVGVQSIAFLAFGAMSAMGIAISPEKYVITSFLASLGLIPFIFGIYVTAVQSSYVLSLGLFEPLKVLPLRVGALYLSELLSIDLIPSFSIVLPSILVVIVKYPISGILALLWMILGVFIGHTLGLLILTFFGLKVSQRKGRGHSLKNLFKIFALMLYMGVFYVMAYAQNYIKAHSEYLASFMGRYSLAYPFTIASIFEPFKSFLLLAVYSVIFGSLYVVVIRRTWSKIIEPEVISSAQKFSKFRPSKGGSLFALVSKDLRIIFRKTAMLTGFLVPLYFALPQLIMGIQSGNFALSDATALFFTVGFMSTAGADAILKVEGKTLDFLRTLPLKKGTYALSKALSMSTVPSIILLLVLGVTYYFNGIKAVYLLPYALMLPLTSSLIVMLYFFHYKAEEIGISEVNFGHIIVLFIIVGVAYALLGAPLVLLGLLKGLPLSYGIDAILIAVLLYALGVSR